MKRNALIVALCASACLGVNIAALQAAPAELEDAGIDPAEVQAARQDAQKLRERANRERERAMKEVESARRETEQAVKHAVQLQSLNMQARSAGEAGDPFGDVEPEFADTFLDFRAPSVAHTGQQPLIVRFSDSNREAETSLREDLPVMNRILTKIVEGEGRGAIGHAMGIVLSTIPGARRPQSLYLEGYGALFLLNVDFPLVAPETETKEPQEKPADSTWEEARREVYGQRRVEVRLRADESRAQFDPEKVENLKNELLKVLKNAANIRELKAEESVTVVVVGTGGRSSERIVRSQVVPNRYNAPRTRLLASAGSRSATTESTLTLRVKKADAAALAEGNIDLQEFTKRASVSAY